MKTLFTIIALFTCATFAKAQNTLDSLPVNADGKIVYESVVNVPDKGKDFLFNAANKWMLDNYHVQNDDKEQGQIIGKGTMKIDAINTIFTSHFSYSYQFNIEVDCKDNKYRVRIYNIYDYVAPYTKPDDLEPLEKLNFDFRNSKNKTLHQNAYKIDARFKSIITSLTASINKAANDDF